MERAQGRWKCQRFDRYGTSDDRLVGIPVDISGNTIVFKTKTESYNATFELNESRMPKEVDWHQRLDLFDGKAEIHFKGLYVLEGDVLLFCIPDTSGKPRPETFAIGKESGNTLIVLTRE
jgi:uncharacterized protein (TIGR03067 family)